jgi:hypothetical protein
MLRHSSRDCCFRPAVLAQPNPARKSMHTPGMPQAKALRMCAILVSKPALIPTGVFESVNRKALILNACGHTSAFDIRMSGFGFGRGLERGPGNEKGRPVA